MFSSFGRFSSYSQRFSTHDVVIRPKCILRKALLLLLAPKYLNGDRLERETCGLCDIAQNTLYKVMEVRDVPTLETFGPMFSFTYCSQDFRRMYLQYSAPRMICFDEQFLSQCRDLLSALQYMRV